jgi:putative transposase
MTDFREAFPRSERHGRRGLRLRGRLRISAYAERFVRSIKHECLNRMIPVGENHLRRTIMEYVEHYQQERNHQGLANELIDGPSAIARDGRIRRRPRLGGLLSYYCRAA